MSYKFDEPDSYLNIDENNSYLMDYDGGFVFSFSIWSPPPLTWWRKVLLWNPCNPWRYDGLLNDSDMRSLSLGANPLTIQSESLSFYMPLTKAQEPKNE